MADAAEKALNKDSDNSLTGSIGGNQIPQDGTGE